MNISEKTKNLLKYISTDYVEEVANDTMAIKRALSSIEAMMFLDFIESQGFNPENHDQILELNQDVVGSVSLYLEQYHQFLLSDKVNYSELHEFNRYGGYGCLRLDGIYIPKTPEADDHFLYGGWLPKVPYTRHWYFYPKIDEYGAVISKGISSNDNFLSILDLGLDFYFGDILNTNDVDYSKKRKILLDRLQSIKTMSYDKCSLAIEKDKSINREFVSLCKKR